MNLRTIAVGIIRNAQQEIFIARRPHGVHMGGFWEFPGGKVEEGETPMQALVRELQEEVGIGVEQARLMATSQHHFPDRDMRFYFFVVEGWRGTPLGNEGQAVRWCLQGQLDPADFPPANAAIIHQLIAEA